MKEGVGRSREYRRGDNWNKGKSEEKRRKENRIEGKRRREVRKESSVLLCNKATPSPGPLPPGPCVVADSRR